MDQIPIEPTEQNVICFHVKYKNVFVKQRKAGDSKVPLVHCRCIAQVTWIRPLIKVAGSNVTQLNRPHRPQTPSPLPAPSGLHKPPHPALSMSLLMKG